VSAEFFSGRDWGGLMGGLILWQHKIRFILKTFYENRIISITVPTLLAAAFIHAHMFCDLLT